MLRVLENLVIRQVLRKQQVPDMLHPGHSRVPHSQTLGNLVPQSNFDFRQGHPLSLPVRQAPSQGQRELLARRHLLRNMGRLLVKNRHAILQAVALQLQRVWQPQLVKSHNHAGRHAQCGIRAMRIEILGKHKSFDDAERTIHQPSFDIDVLRQQNPSSHAQLQRLL